MDRLADRRSGFRIDRQSGVIVMSFQSPILSLAFLDDFSSALGALAGESQRDPLVLHSAHPSVFLAGAHLAEIANLDASSSEPYARRGRRAIQDLENHPAPTIAAIDGSCSGGGFDLVLACDALVVGPGARFRHPGIRRGLITGWSGTTRLPSALGNATARAALLETRELDPGSFSNHGTILQTAGDPLAAALDSARQFTSLDSARLHLWRALRGPGFIDRFNAFVVHKL